jgi:hypothetical protein
MTDLAQPNVRSPKRAEAWVKRLQSKLRALLQLQIQLANHFQSIVVWSAPAHTITTGTVGITPSKNGTGGVRVTGYASISSAALNDEIGMILWIDGAAVVGSPTVEDTTGPIGAVEELFIEWDVTLTPNVAHTVALQASTGSGANLTGVLGVVKVQEIT